jgi:ABC-type transport system involved in multi-copper enzyme maturation permease subunit
MFVALVRRSFARHRALIAALTALLSAFQILDIVVAYKLQQNTAYSQFAAMVPAFIQEAMGGALVGTFVGAVAVGFVHPLVMLSLSCVAIYLASEPAGEVEEGLVDLVVARPVPRHVIVSRSMVVYVTGTFVVVAAMFATSRATVHWLTPGQAHVVAASRLAWLAFNLLAIVWSLGAAALAFASHVRERARAAGTIALIAVFLYLLQFGAAAWEPLRPFARVSPFHYYATMQTLMGQGTPTTHIAGLLATAVVLLGIAYVLYERRDL